MQIPSNSAHRPCTNLSSSPKFSEICAVSWTGHKVKANLMPKACDLGGLYWSRLQGFWQGNKLCKGYKWDIILIMQKVRDSDGTVADPRAEQHEEAHPGLHLTALETQNRTREK